MYCPSLCKAFNWEIIERFIQFCPIISHASEALESVVLNIVNELELSISDCRGQSFDNAANMAGKYSGLQSESNLLIIWLILSHAATIPLTLLVAVQLNAVLRQSFTLVSCNNCLFIFLHPHIDGVFLSTMLVFLCHHYHALDGQQEQKLAMYSGKTIRK
jgi:hypothetical protein